MKAIELRDLLNKIMQDTGRGMTEVTTDFGHREITDIVHCWGCNAFHIVTKDKSSDSD